jgi:hypothetical protein
MGRVSRKFASFHLIGEKGVATAKEGEARVPARVLRKRKCWSGPLPRRNQGPSGHLSAAREAGRRPEAGLARGISRVYEFDA